MVANTVFPVLMAFVALVSCEQVVPPAQVQLVLKARDARADNMNLRLVRNSTLVADFPLWRLSPEERKNFPSKPVVFKLTSHESVTVRRPEVTFDRRTEAKAEGENPKDVRVTLIMKWSNAGGLTKEFINDESQMPGGRTLEITQSEGASSIIAEQFMEIEFALGFGFGKRIKRITSLTREAKRFIVEAEIQIWKADVSTVRIEADENYVIRKAVIDSDVEGNLTRYECNTEDSVEKDGFVFAKRGHIKRTARGHRKDEKIIEQPRVLDEFDIHFEDVRFKLSDEEYKRLTTIDVPPDTMVKDRTGGK